MSKLNVDTILSDLRKKRIALVYDRVNKWGGAERVLLALRELFPHAPLFTSVYHKKKAPWAKNFIVKPTFLQRFPMITTSHEKYPFLMPIAFESFSFEKYDIVISVTSEAAKGIVTSSKTLHVCYCLTPTRYLWSGYKEYFSHTFFRFLAFPFAYYLRIWDQIAAQRPDAIIAISEEVKRRIKKYYKRDAVVVYPPLTFGGDTFDDVTTEEKAWKDKEKSGYFLIVSRLVAYKKIHIAIEACNTLKMPLIIIGSGSEKKKLQQIAGGTITFISNLTDDELVRYYKGCRALLFPGSEDFGLTILEAQSFGKPVIAYRGGGALETIISGKTGEFFYPQSSNALIKILKNFNEHRYNPKDCSEQARKFTKENFTKGFLQELSKYL